MLNQTEKCEVSGVTSSNMKPPPEIRQQWLYQKKHKTRTNCSLKVCEIESWSWNYGMGRDLWDGLNKGSWQADRGDKGGGWVNGKKLVKGREERSRSNSRERVETRNSNTRKLWKSVQNQFNVDLNDGQFSERCDVDGSFFNSSMFWPVLVFGVFMLIVGVLC